MTQLVLGMWSFAYWKMKRLACRNRIRISNKLATYRKKIKK